MRIRANALRPRDRLKAGAQYRRLFRTGRRLDGRLFVLVVAGNNHGEARLGLVASRRVGGATARNRAKRLLREVFRRHRPQRSLDLVLVAKAELLSSSWAELEREFHARLARLTGGRERPGREVPGAPR